MSRRDQPGVITANQVAAAAGAAPWQLSAACRGMETAAFFPPVEDKRARRRDVNGAKAVCRACPVIDQCLGHALRTREPYGVWGGRSEGERAKMLGVESLRYPAPRRRRDRSPRGTKGTATPDDSTR